MDIRERVTVTWESDGTPADFVVVGLEGYDGAWTTISCRAADTGTFTVLAEMLAMAGAQPGGEPGYVWLARVVIVDLVAEKLISRSRTVLTRGGHDKRAPPIVPETRGQGPCAQRTWTKPAVNG